MPKENLLIVESPSKAKTISRYLGKDFQVMATVGHVRDLPTKAGMVDPENSFNMHWQVLPEKKKHLNSLATGIDAATTVWLATDPDREGEAIAWHVAQLLLAKSKKPVYRIIFNEVTKSAIQAALQQPRSINQNLVDAYLARRALDYLVGFNLSPVLWRKLPGTRSAGRVQSVALRLICERESEIDAFKSREYWSLLADFGDKDKFPALLREYAGTALEKFSITNATQAEDTAAKLRAVPEWRLAKIEQKETSRYPAAPFTTSTLQQEAARKLGFSAARTMQVAQKLYEGMPIEGENTGLITYMRTDSVTINAQAIAELRQQITTEFGKDYLPQQVNRYKTKTRNAQEAHEAIRATAADRTPQSIATAIKGDEWKLYNLIWQRSMASQMRSARIAHTVFTIRDPEGQHAWRAHGSQIIFPGFLKIYVEGVDDPGTDNNLEGDKRLLPQLSEGDILPLTTVTPQQHFTQPPPRYTEASLVKKLEELGIGRPSTYAAIMRVITSRAYAQIENKRFVPFSRGRLVTAFLEAYFTKYVAYQFTADMEELLDKIAAQELQWKQLLQDFWPPFHQQCEHLITIKNREVLDRLDQMLEPVLFKADSKAELAKLRKCPECKTGQLGLKAGKFGGFIGCSNYPECKHIVRIDSLADSNDDSATATTTGLPRQLGVDPDSGLMISVRLGPFGPYLQKEAEGKEKPKRVALGKEYTPDQVNLDQAVRMLNLPRKIGMHPDSGEEIVANFGRFGPYVKHKSLFASIPKAESLWDIGLNRAVMLLAEAEKKPKRRFAKRRS